MEALLHIIEVYGLWVVFLCVLLDQGGLPFPAYPPIIVTAAIAKDLDQPLLPVLVVATLAAIIADLLWYAAGKRLGTALLRQMCRLSLSPDSCVGLTRRIYARWGAPSLIVSKYVPGFAAVATTLAGETGTSVRRFVFYDGIGAALWAGGAVALGTVFHTAVGALLLELESLGHYALVLLLAGIALFVALKWWQRYRFAMQIRMSRISIDELGELIEKDAGTIILDVRTSEHRAKQGWIHGAIHVRDISQLDLDPKGEIVVYCDCPNEASAALVVKKLKEKGFSHVRPLAGGMEAWLAQGRPIDR
ncbi:MAG TPA: rhodanese-like domain-containing protein [Burkholderiales bacterium]|nr:rhodanese-like domain-containing protein [Burkholderiales bacterium]